jgi:hypothetical protein
MKPSKKLKSVFALLFVCLLSSCARVPIKNSEWCGDLGAEGASCFNTLNDNSRDISKEEWDKERVGKLCTSPETFADLQAAILKLCKASGRCVYDSKSKSLIFKSSNKNNNSQKILIFFDKVNDFKEQSRQIKSIDN